jgi:hypothetical protein
MIRTGTPRPSKSRTGDERVFHLYGSSCEQVRLIEPYVGRCLRMRAQAQFELHLFSCERCLHAVEFELLVKRAVADFSNFAHFSRSWH